MTSKRKVHLKCRMVKVCRRVLKSGRVIPRGGKCKYGWDSKKQLCKKKPKNPRK